MAPGLQNYSILEARKSSSEWNMFSYALAQKQGVVLNGSGKSDVHLRSWNFRSTIFKSHELRDREGFLTRRRHEDRQKKKMTKEEIETMKFDFKRKMNTKFKILGVK